MNDMIEHKVHVNAHIEVILKIPLELDAMELKGLMLKAQKLFALADNDIIPTKKCTKAANGKAANGKAANGKAANGKAANGNFINNIPDSEKKALVLKWISLPATKQGRTMNKQRIQMIKDIGVTSLATSINNWRRNKNIMGKDLIRVMKK